MGDFADQNSKCFVLNTDIYEAPLVKIFVGYIYRNKTAKLDRFS